MNPLKSVIEFCESEMNKCEGEKYLVCITGNPYDNGVPIKLISGNGETCIVENELGLRVVVKSSQIEERQNLDTDRYNALNEVKQFAQSLLNQTEK